MGARSQLLPLLLLILTGVCVPEPISLGKLLLFIGTLEARQPAVSVLAVGTTPDSGLEGVRIW